MNRLISAFIICLIFVLPLSSQTIYLPASHEVYSFLKRMEARQLISDYKDAAKPLSRTTLAKMLKSLELKVKEMTRVERETFEFLITEFKYELLKLAGDPEPTEVRWHLLSKDITEGIMNVDINYKLARSYNNGDQTNFRTQGIKLYGYAFNDVGFYFNWGDTRENGKYVNYDRIHTSEPGVIPNKVVTTGSNTLFEHNENNVQFTWQTGNFSFSLEKNVNIWGYGKNGNVILSNKAPSYPQIKMRVPISDNIDFIYFHGELNSNEMDSARSYFYYPHLKGKSESDSVRRVDKQKYIAAHMIEISLFNGVDLSIGESIIYSDKGPLLLYLIPVTLFKAGEWYNRDKDNVQLFGSLDLNLIKNVNMYISLFIDELNTDDLFDPNKSRRQLAFTTGLQLYDLPITNMDMTFEYTRANPFVYNHKYPAGDFSNNEFGLGHWIGQNADDIYIELGFTPMHSLRIAAFAEAYRKGDKGNILDQYSEDGGKLAFLFNLQREERTLGIYGSYQPFRDVFLNARIKMLNIEDKTYLILNQKNRMEYYLDASVGLW